MSQSSSFRNIAIAVFLSEAWKLRSPGCQGLGSRGHPPLAIPAVGVPVGLVAAPARSVERDDDDEVTDTIYYPTPMTRR